VLYRSLHLRPNVDAARHATNAAQQPLAVACPCRATC